MSEQSDKQEQIREVTENELIGGRLYKRSPITEPIIKAAEVFQRIAHKYKLTNKPLDEIYEPFTTIPLRLNSNTIIRPILGVKMNKSEVPVDWVVDYAENAFDALAFCIKPDIYRKAGISEYWVLDMENSQIIIYNLKNDGYIQDVITSPRRIKVGIYSTLVLNYSDVFTEG